MWPAMITDCSESRPVHQVDDRFVLMGDGCEVFFGHIARAPPAEARGQQGLDLAPGDVAHHHQRRVAGLEPGFMESGQVLRRQGRNRRLVAGASERQAVSVPVAVKNAGKEPQRQCSGPYLLLLNADDLQLLQAGEVLFRERWIEDDIGIEIERRVQILLQRRHADEGSVQVGTGAQGRAQMQ